MRHLRQHGLPENWVLSLKFWVLNFCTLKFWNVWLEFWHSGLNFRNSPCFNWSQSPLFYEPKCLQFVKTWVEIIVRNGFCLLCWWKSGFWEKILSFGQKLGWVSRFWEFWQSWVLMKMLKKKAWIKVSKKCTSLEKATASSKSFEGGYKLVW